MINAKRPRRPRLEAGVGPLIGLRVFLGPHIWRIAPAWAVLAGALTGSAVLWEGTALLRLLGAAVLADSLWGMLWQFTVRSDGVLSTAPVAARHLPYYQERSPAGRTLRLIRQAIADAGWHELIVVLASTALPGLLIGPPALILTVCAWAITVWAWLLAQAGRRPAACDALLNVGLPWLLGWALMTDVEAALRAPQFWPGPILATAFVVMQWSVQRAYLAESRRSVALWLGQMAVIVALIGLQETAALALTAVLLLPPGWLLWRTTQTEIEVKDAVEQSSPWWLAAMLLSAYMVR